MPRIVTPSARMFSPRVTPAAVVSSICGWAFDPLLNVFAT